MVSRLGSLQPWLRHRSTGWAAREFCPGSRSLKRRLTRQLACSASAEENVRISQLIQAYKMHGHLIADLDPLRMAPDDPLRAPFYLQDVPLLQPETYGIRCDQKMLQQTFWIGDSLAPVLEGPEHSLEDILATLRKVYCERIGTQFAHMMRYDTREWVGRRTLEHALRVWKPEEQRGMLDHIAAATYFEEFFGSRLSGAKRFSLEGGESLIPGLEAVIKRSAEVGIRSIEMGMTHRGRLNVLKNIFQVPLEALVYNFQPYLPDDEEHPNNSDDVRYHLGTSAMRTIRLNEEEIEMSLSMAANPSHLESVNSVVLGKTRARQFLLQGSVDAAGRSQMQFHESERRGSVDYSPSSSAKSKAMAVLLHGDASFYQGSVREVLGFSNLRDYTTGGTIHLIINNQIGFTTMPKSAQSSVYCSDVALSIDAPVFHVNGDDPEAVARVCQTAVDYRQIFQRDCVINIWSYRRHGHNEQDDPKLTQPLMYNKVGSIPKLCTKYASELLAEGVLRDEKDLDNVRDKLGVEYKNFATEEDRKAQPKTFSTWNEIGALSEPRRNVRSSKESLMADISTGVEVELLRSYGRAIFTLPSKAAFDAHPKVRAIFKQRLRSIGVGSKKSIRWATAEALAFASLLEEGFHIRLSGQDVERGTFNQRHAVLYDQLRMYQGNERVYKPWTALQDQEWHQKDIKRDIMKRVNSAAKAPISVAFDAETEEKLEYAGLYVFGDDDKANKEDEREESLPGGDAIVANELRRIQRDVDMRAKQRRNSRRLLRWREPKAYQPDLGEMEICNSPLSEDAILGFEHGYSLYSPNIMAVFEFQFGDFSCCAQTMIDTFIASGEEKWVRSSGLVILVPHGYDGQGPDHSSGKVERFLQLCSEPEAPLEFPRQSAEERAALCDVNMHVLNMTTPAQLFHALRRHMISPVRKPLVIFTPKYLLHHKPCSSSIEEFGPSYSFRSVLTDIVNRGTSLKRIVLCSGKIYYQLAHKRKALRLDKEVLLVRVEQLCPFPYHSLKTILEPHLRGPNHIELVWAQEEPQNMGCWTYIEPRLRQVLIHSQLSPENETHLSSRKARCLTYAGRPASASPATGNFGLHREEQADLLQRALKA